MSFDEESMKLTFNFTSSQKAGIYKLQFILTDDLGAQGTFELKINLQDPASAEKLQEISKILSN